MIEKRTHVVACGDIRPDWAGRILWFEDGMGLKVHDRDFHRACDSAGFKNSAFSLVGCKATLKLVEGRWLLARLELP